MKALSGIKVLDFSQGAAGPYASMLLGDFGADVIKVEPPEGDWARTLGPPFLNGEAATFLSLNRNKKSIVLNLKNPDGLIAAKKMVQQVDILIESFRPQVMEKMGLGYKEISEINPQIIYCSISGFGQTGPWRDKPGVDGVVQAMSGFMSVTGFDGLAPVKGGTTIADLTAGSLASNGVLTALVARERTGRGQKLDLSLLDSMLAIQSIGLAMYFASREVPRRYGSQAPYAVPNGAVATKDGYIMIAANLEPKWKSLCTLIGKKEWIEDPRFKTNQQRVQNRDVLMPMLEEIFLQRKASEWLFLLENADIICAPIANYQDLLQFEQIKQNEMFIDAEHPVAGPYKQVGIAQKLHDTPGRIELVPPLLGQHTREILEDFHFDQNEISYLVNSEAVKTSENHKMESLGG